MMKFECKDMGMDCDFSATGDTKEAAMEAAMAHAAVVHGAMLASLTPEQMAAMPEQLASVISIDRAADRSYSDGLFPHL